MHTTLTSFFLLSLSLSHTHTHFLSHSLSLSPSPSLSGGFSQGGSLAIFSALAYPKRLAGIVSLSIYISLNHMLEKVSLQVHVCVCVCVCVCEERERDYTNTYTFTIFTLSVSHISQFVSKLQIIPSSENRDVLFLQCHVLC